MENVMYIDNRVPVRHICEYELVEYWEVAEERLEEALHYVPNNVTLDEIIDNLADRRMQLWDIDNGNATALTYFHTSNHEKMLTIVTLTGDHMQRWFSSFMDRMEEYARGEGCSRIEAAGRKGWEKVAKPYGWEYACTVVYKEL